MAFEKLESLQIGFETSRNPFIKNRPTLVMIHGAGGCAQTWRSQIHLLRDSFNTLALDLPGHGKTPGPHKTSIGEYSRWLAEVFNALFQERVFLMGHSMGGAITQEVGLSHPQLLQGIILAATGPRLQVAPMFLEGLLDGFEDTVDTIMNYAYAPGTAQSIVREGAQLMKAAGSAVVHSDFLVCDQFDRRNCLDTIDLPCLIICGDKDILTPPKLSKALNQSIKRSELRILPSAGHMVMIESYKAYNQYVRDFVSNRS